MLRRRERTIEQIEADYAKAVKKWQRRQKRVKTMTSGISGLAWKTDPNRREKLADATTAVADAKARVDALADELASAHARGTGGA